MTRAAAGPSLALIAATIGLVLLWAGSASAGISTDELGHLRQSIGQRELRMHIDGEAYVLQNARLDSLGIMFDADGIQGEGRWRRGEKVAPATPMSPVPWERVTALDRRDSGWRRGAVMGALLLPLTVYVVKSQDDFEGWATVFAISSAPVGALGGGIMGALGSVWVPVWRGQPSGALDSR